MFPHLPLSVLSALLLLSYFGNHSDASGLHYHPSFTSGHALLEVLLQLQPEVKEQLLQLFIEGQPFKRVCGGGGSFCGGRCSCSPRSGNCL